MVRKVDTMVVRGMPSAMPHTEPCSASATFPRRNAIPIICHGFALIRGECLLYCLPELGSSKRTSHTQTARHIHGIAVAPFPRRNGRMSFPIGSLEFVEADLLAVD